MKRMIAFQLFFRMTPVSNQFHLKESCLVGKSRKRIISVVVPACFVYLILPVQSWALVVPLSNSSGPAPGYPGTGLDGEFYDVPGGFDSLRFLADADDWIADHTATATFRSTSVHYGFAGADTVGQYLSEDGLSLQPASAFDMSRPASVWRLSGRIAITPEMDRERSTSAIDVEFALGSDDASRLRIGGLDIIRAATINSEGDERGVYSAQDYRQIIQFEGPGLYPVDLVSFDWFGGINLLWYGSIPGGNTDHVPSGLAGVVPASMLYSTVPEPSGLMLAVCALIAIPAFRFGFRKSWSSRCA